MGAVWYLVSDSAKRSVCLGKASEVVEVLHLLNLNGCTDMRFVSDGDEISSDHDESGTSTLQRMTYSMVRRPRAYLEALLVEACRCITASEIVAVKSYGDVDLIDVATCCFKSGDLTFVAFIRQYVGLSRMYWDADVRVHATDRRNEDSSVALVDALKRLTDLPWELIAK